jgi:hypothetical protein
MEYEANSERFCSQKLSPSPTNENWYSLVEQYTLRELTCGSDKLIALSGLARAFWVQTRKQKGVYRGIVEGRSCCRLNVVNFSDRLIYILSSIFMQTNQLSGTIIVMDFGESRSQLPQRLLDFQ